MRTCVCRPEFLQLELIRSLSDDTFARFDPGQNRHFPLIFVTKNNIATLEFFSRQKDVHDLLAFIVEHGLAWNKKDRCRRPGVESEIGLHADTQLFPGIRNFKDRLCGSTLFVDNLTYIDEAALKLLLRVCCGRESRSKVLCKPAKILFEDWCFNPHRVEIDNFKNGLACRDLHSACLLNFNDGTGDRSLNLICGT